MEETDASINLLLKPEIAEKEWLDFIGTFFKLRYTETKDFRQDAVLEELSKANSLQEWIELADKGQYQCYQSEHLYYYPMENPYSYYYQTFYVSMDFIILSLDGKIIMECYNDLFAFFTRLVRGKLADYRLADGLFVYITE